MKSKGNSRNPGIPGLSAVLLAAVCCLTLASPLRAEPRLLLLADFNDPGALPEGMATYPPRISAPHYAMEVTAEDLVPPGSGLTGATRDRGFKNRTVEYDGSTLGARARFFVEERSARSFTITGWYFLPDGVAMTPGGARVLQTDGAEALALIVTPEGGLSLNFGGGSARSRPVFWSTGQWRFFAVTFDGTLSEAVEPNVRFYAGGMEEPPALVSEEVLLEPVGEWKGSGEIAVGNMPRKGGAQSRFKRPFPGTLDNIRILISPEDATGALSPREIKELWTTRKALPPEANR
jgi:hypothetical protein